MQLVCGIFDEQVRKLPLPAPHAEIWPRLLWGDAATAFTPAFWAAQVWLSDLGSAPKYRVGDSLVEEVAVCLLGGFGFRSEIGLAAFESLKAAGLLVVGAPATAIERVLQQPMPVGSRRVRYRFPAQKAKYLGAFLSRIATDPAPELRDGGIALRQWLLGFDGIGLKTASWVARNWVNCDDVAIIDIHIHRAGLLAGFFEPTLSIARDYLELERRFVEFSRAINVRASDLDAVMWDQMREFQDVPIRLLRERDAGCRRPARRARRYNSREERTKQRT